MVMSNLEGNGHKFETSSLIKNVQKEKDEITIVITSLERLKYLYVHTFLSTTV